MSLKILGAPSGPHQPIATEGLVPLAYEVLGVQLHLDELTPENEERLDKAMAMVQTWVGSRLRWAYTTAVGEAEPYESEHLEYVTTYPRKLHLPESVRQIPIENRVTAIGLVAGDATEYEVDCGSSKLEEREHAQLTSFRFYADVSRIFPERPHLSAYSVLRVTVPTDTPLAEFEECSRALVDLLPVRWGTAGLMLSGAEGEFWKAWKHVAFGYCMRYWGVDAGEYFALTEEFYDWIRTVNWLTFLGPSMLHDLETMGARLKPVPEVLQQTLAGGTVLLKAGASPQRGDVNRLDILPAYAAVDRLVRARRCDGTDDAGEEVTFFGAWTRTGEWFRRFEQSR